MPPPQRVRVTSSRVGAPRRARRRIHDEIAEQTELGDVYLRGLMRAQLRLSLSVLLVGGILLLGLPLLLLVVPSWSRVTALGIPLPWVLLGVLVYPGAVVAARYYVAASERIERQFSDVTDSR